MITCHEAKRKSDGGAGIVVVDTRQPTIAVPFGPCAVLRYFDTRHQQEMFGGKNGIVGDDKNGDPIFIAIDRDDYEIGDEIWRLEV